LYSKLIRLCLVLTSLAPLFLSLAFVLFRNSGISFQSTTMGCVALFLFVGSFFCAKCGSKKLEVFSERIEGIKSADSKVFSFLLVYCLPFLIKNEPLPDYATCLYIAVIFGVILYNSNCLYFNPTLGIFGLHLYEIVLKNGSTCVLLSKQTLRGVPNEIQMVRLSEYVLMEKE